ANFPANMNLDAVATRVRTAEALISSYPEVESVVTQIGRPDDGTDPSGFDSVQIFVPLRPRHAWPSPPGRAGPRTKAELIEEMNEELAGRLIGIDWNFSQYIRDNVMESLSGVQGDNSVKIIGPDLNGLEELARKVKNRLDGVRGLKNVGIFRIKGQANLEFLVDKDKCKRWGVQVGDVNSIIDSAVRGKAFTQVIEGEKTLS